MANHRGRKSANRSRVNRSTVQRRPLSLEWLERRTLLTNFFPLAAALDGAPGSLRAAVIDSANGLDDVVFLQAGAYNLTLNNLAGQENASQTGDLDLTDTG